MKVVGVKVIARLVVQKDEVKQLQNQQRQRGFRFAVEKENHVFAKGFVNVTVGGKRLDDAVGERNGRCWDVGDKILFVQNELIKSEIVFGMLDAAYNDSNDVVRVRVVGVVV